MVWKFPAWLTSVVIGPEKLAIRDWKATRLPSVSAPSMTRRPPIPRIAAMVRPANSVGSMSRIVDDSPRACSAFRVLA